MCNCMAGGLLKPVKPNKTILYSFKNNIQLTIMDNDKLINTIFSGRYTQYTALILINRVGKMIKIRS